MDSLKDAFSGGSSEGKENEERKSEGGGFMDKLNQKAGGGKESEKDEDALDKGVDMVQQAMGGGDQSNESAVEQAKDEQISDFIRDKIQQLQELLAFNNFRLTSLLTFSVKDPTADMDSMTVDNFQAALATAAQYARDHPAQVTGIAIQTGAIVILGPGAAALPLKVIGFSGSGPVLGELNCDFNMAPYSTAYGAYIPVGSIFSLCQAIGMKATWLSAVGGSIGGVIAGVGTLWNGSGNTAGVQSGTGAVPQ
ncbi:MAG: hypothetical protein Q9159_004422 [Coniocarpon cinnabarinum]